MENIKVVEAAKSYCRTSNILTGLGKQHINELIQVIEEQQMEIKKNTIHRRNASILQEEGNTEKQKTKEITAQDLVSHLQVEYRKMSEGKEADDFLEKILFIQDIRTEVFYKRMKEDLIFTKTN